MHQLLITLRAVDTENCHSAEMWDNEYNGESRAEKTCLRYFRTVFYVSLPQNSVPYK